MSPQPFVVEVAESAAADLEEVLAWYAAQDVPEVGIRLVRAVRERLDQLRQFPESGAVLEEFDNPNLRQLIHPPFRIVYRFTGEKVVVVRIWRFERLLADDTAELG
ncbi:MAG: type II toxin-antitoxin system RelE/ParE family toxin [Actinomycetes bacterium]|jgi:plasmid stabilization system protein ParE|nr:type II toxin-antitoxin system RelE/ParE family toxin [Actinomycetes bacterium]